MTAPRQVLPGSTYLLTRRCAHRQLLLRPSTLVNQIFLYCFARAAERTGVLLHALVVMGNHVHAVLTDPDGRLPEFTHWLFEHTAKCRNASLGRWENLWSSESPSEVRLESIHDVLDKVLYVMANPTKAALVPKASEWPGVVSLPGDFLRGPVEVDRPAVFFRELGPTPKRVKLELVPPAGIEEETVEEFVEMLADELELREADIRLQHKAEGRPIMGRRAVLEQDPFAYPEGMEPRRNLNPRVAAKNKWQRIEALGRMKEFLRAYAEALASFLEGKREVVFPAGTYWMVRYAGALAAAPG